MSAPRPELARVTLSVLFVGGLFIGPVVLAVACTLLDSWVSAPVASMEPASPAAVQGHG